MKQILNIFILVLTFFISIAYPKEDTKMLFYSATEISKLIQDKKITSEKVVTSVIDQIQKYNDKYNAVVTINSNALEEARKYDELLSNGIIIGPLHGVPIIVKDSYKVKGLRTTSGYLPLKDYIPKEDAVVIKLLKESGAIIIGKGNMPTLAMDMQTENTIFGRTNNPWDITRTCGGSTGGDAVAVASGFAYIGFGSDLAGSLRIPTSFTGTYGLKTTYGIVSKLGHIPPLPTEINGLHSLAVMGPVARNIDDLELALKIISQPHHDDKSIIPIYPNNDDYKISDLKIAWVDSFGGIPVQKEIKDKIKNFVTSLEGAGAKVTKVEPEFFNYEEVWEMWGSFVGHQGGYENSNFKREIGSFFTKHVTKDIPMHRKIVGSISVPQYMELLNKQKEYITKLDNFLDKYDIWITPVSSTTAFKHIKPSENFGNLNVYKELVSVDGDKIPYYTATQAYTTIFAVTENPVVSMPIGIDSDSLPIGIQVISKRFQDFKLLKTCKILSQYNEKIIYPLEK